jgi:hypothetical protein
MTKEMQELWKELKKLHLEWKLQQSKQVSATSSFFLRRW